MSGTSMITLMHAQIVPQFVGMRHITKTTTVTVHALLAQAHPTMPCICLVLFTVECSISSHLGLHDSWHIYYDISEAFHMPRPHRPILAI